MSWKGPSFYIFQDRRVMVIIEFILSSILNKDFDIFSIVQMLIPLVHKIIS